MSSRVRSNQLSVLRTLGDPVQLRDDFKCKILEAANVYNGARPRLWRCFTLGEMLTSMEESRADMQACFVL